MGTKRLSLPELFLLRGFFARGNRSAFAAICHIENSEFVDIFSPLFDTRIKMPFLTAIRCLGSKYAKPDVLLSYCTKANGLRIHRATHLDIRKTSNSCVSRRHGAFL